MITLNTDIPLDRVVTEGYTSRDLNQYYQVTYLLHMPDENTCEVVLIGEIADDLCRAVYYKDGEHKSKVINLSDCYRFTPEQGFYYGDNMLFVYSYAIQKSYKKGLNDSLVQTKKFRASYMYTPPDGRQHQTLRCLNSILDANVVAKDCLIISRRIAVSEGKVYESNTLKTLGSFDGTTLTTPFQSVIDRFTEKLGDIKCHLTPLKTI
jgi:hypothetical protein